MIDRKLLNELYKKHHSYAEIARIFQVSRQRIHQILRNYKSVYINKKTKKILSKICQICYERAKLIHHIDRNRQNNKPQNLLPLCLKCHYELHKNLRTKKIPIPTITICQYCQKEFKTLKNRNHLPKYCSQSCYNKNRNIKYRSDIRWSWQYDECVVCRQTDRPYTALGMCSRCYRRIQARERRNKF